MIKTALLSFLVSSVVIPLWKDQTAPTSSGLPADAEEIVNSGWISLVTNPELTVYPAENPNGMALLMCPGGGYSGVAISHEGQELAPLMNDNGITYAVLKYRMPNQHPEVPGEDVKEALRILKSHSIEWGIDTTKIGIGGASAGGHLASTIATHQRENPEFSYQVLLYPVISMKNGVTHPGSRENLLGENPDENIVDYYSNELQVNPTTPQAFIALSGDDTVVPVKNSIDYFNALNSLGIPVSMHIYPVGGHGWGNRENFAYSKEWKQELISWLNSLFPTE